MSAPPAQGEGGQDQYLLAIDVETSGQGLATNFLIQIGAALVDVKREKVVAKFSSFVRQPLGKTWEKRCVDEFWSLAKNVELWERAKREMERAPSLEDVRLNLLFWVYENVTGKTTTVVFDTAGFDAEWLDHLLQDTSAQYLFGSYATPRDLNSFCLGVARVSDLGKVDSSKGAAAQALGPSFSWPKWDVEHDHDAGNDAAVIGLNFAHLLNHLSLTTST